jgi:hypothetical protein
LTWQVSIAVVVVNIAANVLEFSGILSQRCRICQFVYAVSTISLCGALCVALRAARDAVTPAVVRSVVEPDSASWSLRHVVGTSLNTETIAFGIFQISGVFVATSYSATIGTEIAIRIQDI